MAEDEKQSVEPKPARGGFREGSGRKKGVSNKIQLVDCMEAEEIADIIDTYTALAKKDAKVCQHFIDQIFGRAKTTIAGDPENPLMSPFVYVKGAQEIAKKYEADLKKKLKQ